MCVLNHFSCVWLFATLWTDSAKLLCPWNSPGKNTGVGYPALLQGIFPTQGSKPRLLPLLHRRRILYCWATREAQNKNIRYILVQLLYGRWHISWRCWRCWDEFWNQRGMDKIQTLTLSKCVPMGKLLSISAPLFFICKTTFKHCCTFRDSFVHSCIYSVIKCLLNIG